MPNPLIALLLLLGGANRPNDALRPQRRPTTVSDERRGLAECASSAAAFGSVGILVALAQHERVGTTTLLASRYALGAIALWIALIALRHPLPGLRIALAAVALGATAYASASALYLASIERMGAGPAGVVSYCYPVLVMAGAITLGRERMSRRRAIALGLAVTGVVLLVAGHGLGAVNGPGALLAFGSAAAYTAYVLASAALRDRAQPLALSTLVATGAAGAFARRARRPRRRAGPHGDRRARDRRARARPDRVRRRGLPLRASAASAPRARASPRRSSPPSPSPAASSCSASSSCAAQFLGAALVVAAVLAIELRQLPRSCALAGASALRACASRAAARSPPARAARPAADLVQRGVVGHARDEAVAAALALEHARPELARRRAEHVVDARGLEEPVLALQLALELPGAPAGVAGERAHAAHALATAARARSGR